MNEISSEVIDEVGRYVFFFYSKNLKTGYKVFFLIRKSSFPNFERVEVESLLAKQQNSRHVESSMVTHTDTYYLRLTLVNLIG